MTTHAPTPRFTLRRVFDRAKSRLLNSRAIEPRQRALTDFTGFGYYGAFGWRALFAVAPG
ncbi:MAG TPA: hypothetical protein VG370_17780 [Chloroflexota bacterium]|nr:hypothetical protein [Chloroflexota bacterium]